MILVGIPVIVVQIWGISDTSIGITQGAMGLGGIAGGIIAGAAAEKIRLKSGYIFLIICSLAAFFMGISVFEVVFDNDRRGDFGYGGFAVLQKGFCGS